MLLMDGLASMVPERNDRSEADGGPNPLHIGVVCQ